MNEARRADRTWACGTTGAVSRMKSFQNCPGSSSASAGGVRRISRSSKPFSARSSRRTTPRSRRRRGGPAAAARRRSRRSCSSGRTRPRGRTGSSVPAPTRARIVRVAGCAGGRFRSFAGRRVAQVGGYRSRGDEDEAPLPVQAQVRGRPRPGGCRRRGRLRSLDSRAARGRPGAGTGSRRRCGRSRRGPGVLALAFGQRAVGSRGPRQMPTPWKTAPPGNGGSAAKKTAASAETKKPVTSSKDAADSAAGSRSK